MSRVFDAYFFSPSYEVAEKAKEDALNAEWELYEAGQDLLLGIQENQPQEFIFFTENQTK